MTKKLMLITVAALGLLYSEASLAKVCRLGDLSCDTNGFYGVGEGECDSSYKTCANPRAGATFCYAGDEAKSHTGNTAAAHTALSRLTGQTTPTIRRF